jgi:serine phosphatase RsbU (regulator of sigma subunit)
LVVHDKRRNETVDIIDVQLLSIDFSARRLSYATAGDTLGVLKARL